MTETEFYSPEDGDKVGPGKKEDTAHQNINKKLKNLGDTMKKKTSKSSINSISVGEKISKKKSRKALKFLGAGFGVTALIGVIAFVVIYFVAVKPAFALLTNINTLKSDVNQMQAAAIDRDLLLLGQLIDQTEQDLEDLRQARDNNIGWAKEFGPTKEYYSDSDHFIDAGKILLDAGRDTIILMEPFADAGGFKVSEEQEVIEIGLAEAFASWVALMPEIADDTDPVLEKLSEAGEVLSRVDASRYPENFRGQPLKTSIEGAQNTLSLVNEAAPDIKLALQIIPTLLGVDAPEKRYMIMMQNDKEIRGTGGFWTYFSTFKLNNALLTSDFTSYGSYNIDFALEIIDPFYTFPKVPVAYERYLKVERMYARDANISPDLPTSVAQFELFWELAGQQAPAQFKPINGIFTIDTVVLEELLEVTGPVTLNGVTYNPDTVTLELEKLASLALQEQANRKKVLGDLMEAMLKNVFESDSNLWPVLIDKGIDLASRKHVQVFVYDEQAQELLEKYNLAGRIVDPVEGDYAFLTSTNLGGGKTNSWFVTKSVDHKLEKEGDRWVRTVAATFTYGDKGPDYEVFRIPRYQDWLRLYVPLGSELISIEGAEDTNLTCVEEQNKTCLTAYFGLARDETKTVTFKYYLPEDVINGNEYKLYLQKQSGIQSEPHTVSVGRNTEEVDLLRDKTVTLEL